MIDFNQFTAVEQVTRLSLAAENALSAYDIGQSKITLVKHEMNTIFKVEASHGSYPENTFVMRISPKCWLDFDSINSESIFLAALAQNSDLKVAEPVMALDGSYVQIVTADDIPEPRFCVLFKWLDGYINNECFSNMDLKLAGEYLARLHDYSEVFKPPAGFKRPRLDLDGLFGTRGLFNPGDGCTLFSAEQQAIFDEALNIFKEKLKGLDHEEGQTGFLHGDYYYSNMMFNDNSVAAFDFDMCGWGYCIFDIIIPYWPHKQSDIDEALRLFLNGYKSVRRLPEGVVEYRETFDAIRRLIDAYWIVTRTDNPNLKSWIPNILEDSAHRLKLYIDKSEELL